MGGFKVPDEVGYHIGWRAWKVKADFDEKHPIRLMSPQQRGHMWLPREVMYAKCGGKYNEADPPPHKNHMCGLYATKTLNDLLNNNNYHLYDGENDGWYCVVGKVKLWGRYEPGSIGYRGEKCYPATLYVPYEVAMHPGRIKGLDRNVPFGKALVFEYGVKIELKNLLGDSYLPEDVQAEVDDPDDGWYTDY